ncbi:hypothetical protein D039_0191A, partial [Vibrio parahaemolyticus EKP-028]
MPVICNAAA